MAASAEAQYHLERIKHWKQEQDAAQAELEQTAGVKVHKYPVTGGERVGVTVKVDPHLTERLNLAGEKIGMHQKAADQFQIEAGAYASQGDRLYELHPDDIVYFRLTGATRPE